jgi:hypothetical protein
MRYHLTKCMLNSTQHMSSFCEVTEQLQEGAAHLLYIASVLLASLSQCR